MAPLTGKNAKRRDALAGFYVLAGSLVGRANTYDGLLLVAGSQDRATEFIQVARHHPALMKMIDAMIEGNVYFNMAMGHGIIAMAILMNHGRLPMNDQLLGYFHVHPQQIIPPDMQPKPEPEPVKPKRTRRPKVAASV